MFEARKWRPTELIKIGDDQDPVEVYAAESTHGYYIVDADCARKRRKKCLSNNQSE